MEDDDPAQPSAGTIQHRLERSLCCVIKLQICLDFFTDVTPEDLDEELEESRKEVNGEGKEPGDEEVDGYPYCPRGNLVVDLFAVVIGVLVEPKEFQKNGWGDD